MNSLRTLILRLPNVWNPLGKCAQKLSTYTSRLSLLTPRSISMTHRYVSHKTKTTKQRQSVLLYIISGGVVMVGVTYAGVPIYRKFCQQSGLGGSSELARSDNARVEEMLPVRHRQVTVEFTADTHSSLAWNFRPQQRELRVVPGETALAFYTATNPTNQPIIGIATYNILPVEAGKYFNKIQCFCFEEQRLNPHEQVDMPVFFFLDPEFDEDPRLMQVDRILLSYTFFEAKEGLQLPLPGYSPS